MEPKPKAFCKNIEKHGSCKFGDKCHLSHVQAPKKDEPCYYFTQRGMCEKVNCAHKHPLPESTVTFRRDVAFGDQDLSNGKKLLTHAVLAGEQLILVYSDSSLVFQGTPSL